MPKPKKWKKEMALSEKLEALEKKMTQELDDLRQRQKDHLEILYNTVYGLGVKIDILQAIILETINELSDEVKTKVLNQNNLDRIAAEAQEGLQRRMDMIGWGDNPEEAPMRQLLEDKERVDSI
jgi:hypothetical protein